MSVEKTKGTTKSELLDEESLNAIQGGTEIGYTAVKGASQACSRYFPAINQTVTRQCESCFYYHPLEQEEGYCSR